MRRDIAKKCAAVLAVVITISGCGGQVQQTEQDQAQAEVVEMNSNYDFTVNYDGIKKVMCRRVLLFTIRRC